jgi:hypothetical protein
MDLTELYRRLAVGELSNLSLAEGGVIDEEKKAEIVLYANSGLKKLYTRFLLKEDSLFIDEQIGNRTNYPLDKKYALSNTDVSDPSPRYINDIGRPFTNDVIKVMAVYDGHGCKLPINDPNRRNSVYTPQPALLQIPHPIPGAPLGILYQASHTELLVSTPLQVLELPEFLTGALTAFVASKVFSHMNTQESTAKAAEHLRNYESICIETLEQDLVPVASLTGEARFVKNGWV